MKLKTEIKIIVAHLNKGIRKCEGTFSFEMIRFTLAGLAEQHAHMMFGASLAEIDPKLAALLNRIKDAGGELVGDDAFQLVDYGIAALDLRAPEDR